MSDSNIPPLRGDGSGRYRILLVGNSGSGKTTLSAELALILGIPAISLDELFWRPGWVRVSKDEFKANVAKVLSSNDKGWVVDGLYAKRLGSLTQDQATDIIWLDPPLVLYFPRICMRTFLRILGVVPSCSSGCDETLYSVFFSKDSILRYCLSNHWRLRRQEQDKFLVEGIHVGGKRRRLGGWGSELETWKQSVRDMVRTE